jgi:hypothetical protein
MDFLYRPSIKIIYAKHLKIHLYSELFSTEKPLQYIFTSQGTSADENDNTQKVRGAAGRARRLLHYYELPDKYSRDISMAI